MTHDPDAAQLGRTPGLAEEHFRHDGLITKRHVRALALAELRPRPGELLWDLGTGAGSVAVEWCRTDPSCRAIGVERRADRAANARFNAAELTLPGQFEVVEGSVDDVVGTLPRPDAVFIGGGATDALVDTCRAALPGGGRLVVHAVTVEGEVLIASLLGRLGGQAVRVAVESGDRIGTQHGWKPARTITAWSYCKGV